MTLSPFLPSHDAETVRLRAGVFVAQLAYEFRTSQTAIIAALVPVIAPSQPEPTSLRTAADTLAAPTASDTTGGEETAQPSSQPSFPSVEPSPEPLPLQPAVQAVAGDTAAPTSPAESEAVAISAPIQPSQPDETRREAGTAPGDDAAAGKSDGEDAAPSASASDKDTLRDRIVAAHHANPDWPAKLLAGICGTSEDQVRAAASVRKLKLPRWWDYLKTQQARTTEALKAEVAPSAQPEPEQPPAVPAEPASAPVKPKRVTLADKIRAHLAKHPDATLKEVTDATGENMQALGWAAQRAGIELRKRTAEERSEASARGAQGRARPTPPAVIAQPPVQRDATDVLHRVQRAPSGRFYMRDKTTLAYVHQCLQLSPSGTGPMMTTDRKWAWYDTMERYRGAVKVWPGLVSMRKEAAAPK